MRGGRWIALPLVALGVSAFAADGGFADPPPETVLAAPPIVAVGHAPTPWMRSQIRRLKGTLGPARRPRTLVLARLRLAAAPPPTHVWFATYRSRSQTLCGVMFDSGPGFSGLATGGLACASQCTAVCVGGDISDRERGWQSFVATVPVAADSVRATLADGTRFRFPLNGPSVFGARDRRVVIAELPSGQPMTLVEALQGETVVGSERLGGG
jgi:hypothetical protein